MQRPLLLIRMSFRRKLTEAQTFIPIFQWTRQKSPFLRNALHKTIQTTPFSKSAASQPAEDIICTEASTAEIKAPLNDCDLPADSTIASNAKKAAKIASEIFSDPLLASLVIPTRHRCYNCGVFGHAADDCDATSIRKVCYNCGGAGHLSRECPEVLKPIFCFRCMTPGHYSNECVEPVPNLTKGLRDAEFGGD